MKNLSRNNNNSSNSNFNHLGNTCPVGSTTNVANPTIPESPKSTDNFSILQTNSKKILESTRKQHKYLAKRKILMHYNEELNEKRRKELEMERDLGYGIQHDANNNNQETIEPITTTTTTNTTAKTIAESTTSNFMTTTTPTTTTTTSGNSFKIRLLENHLNNNGNGKDNGHDNTELEMEEEMEEEALNLAQNTQNRQEKIMPNMELVKTEPMTCDLPDSACNININNNNINNDNDDIGNDDNDDDDDDAVHNNKNDDILSGRKNDKDNNNNNNNSIDAMDTDDNNNNNSIDVKKSNRNLKHTANALLNAINRNMGLMENNDNVYITRAAADDLNESDNNNNNNIKINKNSTSDDQTNDNNNNYSNQLDLSNTAGAVKNIATAEILCGLKSKVFHIEEEREREACRNRTELHNAE